jgi:D-cysteine desulfhydrase family pyridoxal phosphate-dependent enzyme
MMNTKTITELRAAIERQPRVRLAHLPTPLEELPRLSESLGVRLWMKRDDCTGLGFGGNKARQLEFTLGDARARGCDTIVQGAGSQSNHCRQAAAACARLGLACHLVLLRDAKSGTRSGNLLLDHLFGAEIEFADAPLGPDLDAAKEARAERLRAQGRKPYVIAGVEGASRSALGYVNQLCELVEQLAERDVRPDFLYLCSGGATQAGLTVAARELQVPFRILAVAPIRWPYDTCARIAEVATATAERLGLSHRFTAAEIENTDAYVGEAYGKVTPEGLEALRLVATTEGILLDPVYTAKAMAGLIDHVRRGLVPAGSTVVFVHTGGTPALFAYAEEV